MRKFLPPHRHLTEDEKLIAKMKLAKEVLYEVPGQLVSYMKSKGIYPRPPDNPFEITEIPYYTSTQSRHGSIKSIKSNKRGNLIKLHTKSIIFF